MLALDGFVHGLHTWALISNGHGGYESPSHFSTSFVHALIGVDAMSILFGSRPPVLRFGLGHCLVKARASELSPIRTLSGDLSQQICVGSKSECHVTQNTKRVLIQGTTRDTSTLPCRCLTVPARYNLAYSTSAVPKTPTVHRLSAVALFVTEA